MKGKSIFILILCFVSASVMAQVMEKDGSMSEGVQNALTLDLRGNKRLVEGQWKDFTKKFGKLERDKKTKEFILNAVIIPAIDTEFPVTIVSKFEEFNDMTRGYFWFKQEERFLNSIDNETEISGADVFLTNFSIEVQKEYVSKELKEEEKKLKKLEKSLDKLVDKNDDLHKDIEKAEDTIRKSKMDIERNLKEQEELKKEIEAQRQSLNTVSSKMNRIGKN